MPAHVSTTVIAPPVPLERVDPHLLTELCAEVDERGQVTVHCALMTDVFDAVRVWPTTYLVCRGTGHRSALLHAEGIPYAPTWMAVPANRLFEFILVFAPLPRDCDVFDLVELISDPGGFHVPGIGRNDMDVYRVDL